MRARPDARAVLLSAAAILCAVTWLAACASPVAEPGQDDGPPSPWPRARWALDAAPGDAQEQELAALGRLLFYDPVLSSDGETACATCHSELWGMSDGLPLPIGAFAGSLSGPGRNGDRVGRRNSLSLWNVGLRSSLMWDGRFESLEEQALSPLRNRDELDLPVADAVAALAAVDGYVEMFAAAFAAQDEPPISGPRIARALAAFERGLLSHRAPYDAYRDGDVGALSDQMIDGMFLFAELGCDDCHAPPTFDSPGFADRAIGKGDDTGREQVTDEAADRGRFRVPTLRNARETGPYFHDGSQPDLRCAIEHEARLQARAGARTLTAEEVDAVHAFVSKALLDLSSEPDRPEQVPSGLAVPRDGFRIPR